MKRLIVIAIALAFLIAGCQSIESPVSPSQEQLAKKAETSPLSVEFGFMNLPTMKQTGGNLMDDLTEAVLISGNEGGKLDVEGKLGVSHSGLVQVHGSLEIPKYSFTGSKVISMSVDKGTTSVSFGPSGSTFAKSLILDLEYTGLKLTGIDTSSIKFAYLGYDGKVYPVTYASLNVDVKNGVLTVRGAQIDHFSRFGFVR